MTDPRSRPAGRQSSTPTARTSVQTSTDQHRRVHVERGRRRAARHHRPRRAGRPAGAHARRRSSTWSATSPTASTTTGTTTATGAKLTAWPPTGEPLDPILSSVDNGWLAAGLRIVASRVPELSRARRRALRRDGLRLLLPAGRQPDPVPLRARHRRPRPAATTRSSARAGSPTTSGSPRASCRRKEYYGALADVPGHLRLLVPGDASRSASTRTYVGVDVFEGALPVRRHAGHAVLGRQHVRGADARRCSCPRSAGRRGSWGVNHPLTVDAQIHHGLHRGRLRLLGLLAVEHAGGRLRRVRRRRRSAWTRTATRPTRTTRWSTTASPAARAATRSPTRRRRPTPTASSRRTPRSWRCATRRRDAAPTWRGSSATSRTSTASGASATRSTSTAGAVSGAYLSLDQGMIMAALGNALGDDVLRRAFATRATSSARCGR